MDNRDKRNVTILYISVAICLVLYLSTYLMNGTEEVDVAERENTTSEAVNETEQEPKPKKIKPIVIQPTCHISYMHLDILPEIVADIRLKRELCTPEDIHNEEKHKVPKSASRTKINEPPDLVIYIAVALLLTSLGAAFLDFYRAKVEQNSPDGNKKKPSLTRRCSLADLTVLRHSRKESMRKDSVFEGNAGTKVIGTRPILHRQCTYPSTSADFQNIQVLTNGIGRRGSLALPHGEDLIEHKHTRYRLFLRRH